MMTTTKIYSRWVINLSRRAVILEVPLAAACHARKNFLRRFGQALVGHGTPVPVGPPASGPMHSPKLLPVKHRIAACLCWAEMEMGVVAATRPNRSRDQWDIHRRQAPRHAKNTRSDQALRQPAPEPGTSDQVPAVALAPMYEWICSFGKS